MYKSVVKCAIVSSVNVRYCEHTFLNFSKFKPILLYFASYNTNNCNKSTVCKYGPIFHRHFFTPGSNLCQPHTKLSTPSKVNISTENVTSPPPAESVQEPKLFENINFDEIAGGDEENLNKFKLLLLEVDVLRQDGMKIPKTMSTDQWKELFSLKTKSQRFKYLNYLWTLEIKKLSDKRKKEKKRLENLEKNAQLEIENNLNEHIRYGFQGSTIFLRVYETTMNQYYNNKLIQAMRYGQDIVIDCGYDTDMSTAENKLCAKQLGIIFADNRKDKEPFNLHFCNMKRDSILFTQFKKIIPTIDDPRFPINMTEDHYLNLFPKEKLVYLTPHCRTELSHFNHDDVYIIGALVDKLKQDPLSLAKAKSEGIRMAQFPLDRYLDWALGTKSLTVNQVLSILLDIRTTGNWNEAFKHVPRRKLRQTYQPVIDKREVFRRGTTFYPPSVYDRKKKRFYY